MKQLIGNILAPLAGFLFNLVVTDTGSACTRFRYSCRACGLGIMFACSASREYSGR